MSDLDIRTLTVSIIAGAIVLLLEYFVLKPLTERFPNLAGNIILKLLSNKRNLIIVAIVVAAGSFLLQYAVGNRCPSADEITLKVYRTLITFDQTTQVRVELPYYLKRKFLFDFYSDNGFLDPGLDTPSDISIYSPPSFPVVDTIHVDIKSSGCPVVGKSVSVHVGALVPPGSPSDQNTKDLPTETANSTNGKIQGKFAFVSNREGNEEIYVLNSTGDPVNLTNNPFNDGHPSWSPDGTKIAFHSERTGNGLSDIFLMEADGSNLLKITSGEGWNGQPSWSPDGRRIIFESTRSKAFRIYSFDLITKTTTLLTPNMTSGYPVYSPDGQMIAFHSNDSGNMEIYIMKSDGSYIQNISDNPAEEWMPVWLPSGNGLIYSSNRNGNFDYFQKDLINGKETELTTRPEDDWWPVAFSSDGSQIAFASGIGEAFDIFIMNVDGSNIVPLITDPAKDVWPAWIEE